MGVFNSRRALIVFAVAAWSASLSCCYAQYNTNLATADVSWGAVLSVKRLPYVEGKGVVSQGPFYIDTNHREGALLVGPLVVWTNDAKPDGDPKTALGRVDLTHTKVEINAVTNYAPFSDRNDPLSRSRVYFWFQAALPHRTVAGDDEQMPPRYANYVLPINLLSPLVSGSDVALRIEPDLNQWKCLGRNPVDLRSMIGSAAKYTCALDQKEFAWAMAHPGDMGLLILLPRHTADGALIDWLDPKNPARTPILNGSSFNLTKFIIECDDCHPEANIDARAFGRHRQSMPSQHYTPQSRQSSARPSLLQPDQNILGVAVP
jgi:hypothetical protein